jgi:hypothetical protein
VTLKRISMYNLILCYSTHGTHSGHDKALKFTTRCYHHSKFRITYLGKGCPKCPQTPPLLISDSSRCCLDSSQTLLRDVLYGPQTSHLSGMSHGTWEKTTTKCCPMGIRPGIITLTQGEPVDFSTCSYFSRNAEM